MTPGEVLKIIAEILALIAKHIPVSAAITEVAEKHGLSESEVWDMWNNRI